MFQLLTSSGWTGSAFDHTIMMTTHCNNLLCNFYYPNYSITNDVTKFCLVLTRGNSLCQNPVYSGFRKHHFDSVLVGVGMEQIVKEEVKEGNERRYRWIEVGKNVTKEQQQAISKLPFRMADRSKALMQTGFQFWKSWEQRNILFTLRYFTFSVSLIQWWWWGLNLCKLS